MKKEGEEQLPTDFCTIKCVCTMAEAIFDGFEFFENARQSEPGDSKLF